MSKPCGGLDNTIITNMLTGGAAKCAAFIIKNELVVVVLPSASSYFK